MDHVTSTTDESTPSTSKLGNRASITPSILRAQLEAIERNKKILYSTYVFKKDSPLQPYIKKKINKDNDQLKRIENGKGKMMRQKHYVPFFSRVHAKL